MTATKYTLKDWVTVKQWDQMVDEYGTDTNGDIPLCDSHLFYRYMKNICGNSYVIRKKKDGDMYYLHDSDWMLTDEMIAHNFRYNELVYVRDSKDSEWEEAHFKWFDYNRIIPWCACKKNNYSAFYLFIKKFESSESDEDFYSKNWNEKVDLLNKRLEKIEAILEKK